MTDDRGANLYKKFGPAIFARCRRILASASAAEDATQEIFLRVVKHLDKAPTSVEALMWIYRIATNYCLNQLRDDRRRPRLSGAVPVEAQVDGGEDLLATRDFAQTIIDRAPEHLRASAWLYHVDGMNHEEVGRTLGVSRRTVINYLEEFRERTRRFHGAES